MTDRTAGERRRRHLARKRGEDVPFRPTGRPKPGFQPLVERPGVDQLLGVMLERLEWLTDEALLGACAPGDVELYDVCAWTDRYQAATSGDRHARLG
jgi:hypothetical protein